MNIKKMLIHILKEQKISKSEGCSVNTDTSLICQFKINKIARLLTSGIVII